MREPPSAMIYVMMITMCSRDLSEAGSSHTISAINQSTKMPRGTVRPKSPRSECVATTASARCTGAGKSDVRATMKAKRKVPTRVAVKTITQSRATFKNVFLRKCARRGRIIRVGLAAALISFIQ